MSIPGGCSSGICQLEPTELREFVVFTLFPDMFHGVLGESMLRRAIEQQKVHVELCNFRLYATDKHRTVDDYPFGGGAGMLLKPEPLFSAVSAVRTDRGHERARIVLLSPQGRVFNQQVAAELAADETPLYLLCGHYEGFDDRIRQHLATDEISIGDFVLTGGELAAMVILDAVIRLLPGVLGNDESAAEESHSAGLLEFPQFTRPADYLGMTVPTTLLSGNHQRIAEWRHRHALYRTWVRRPDLLAKRELSEQERTWIEAWAAGDTSDIDVVE
ncbi:MAG: tRNA (guanosine(37)-N1)-methyltransferase TrmD [Alicyclobacillus sp.]|nr:tRNA (guanosine(37)-N1)-methyltransferase TrmD [Alicyclobacillus sp.]